MKKVGRLLLCFVPLIIVVALQFVIGLGVYIPALISELANSGVPADQWGLAVPGIMARLATDTDVSLRIISIFQIVSIIGFGLFYWFGMKEKDPAKIGETFSVKSFLAVVLLFVGVECIITSLLFVIQYIAPEILESYAELIESSGLGELSLFSTIVAVVLAPIAEEIIFRGITFKLARKFTAKFWIANTIQALMFGIAHGNLVQGTYAFALGLVIGYIYRKFNSLWAAMLAHLTFNFAGTWLVSWIYAGEDMPVWYKPVIISVLAAAVAVCMIVIINKDKKVRINEAGFNCKYNLENPDHRPAASEAA